MNLFILLKKVVYVKDNDDVASNLKKALLGVDKLKTSEIFSEIFSQHNSFELIEEVVLETLKQIGYEWENGDVSLAQVYMSGILCEKFMNEYIPKLKLDKRNSPKIGIGVLLDKHSLGKSIVSSIVSAAGYEIKDLGSGLTPKALVDLAQENKVDIILISTLMLPSAMKVREVHRMIKDENLNIKIVVGGAPFRLDDQLWKTVGADARGKTASDVIDVIERLE